MIADRAYRAASFLAERVKSHLRFAAPTGHKARRALAHRAIRAIRPHSPGGEEASTADRHSNHYERGEDQRRGQMPERLPVS